MTAKERGERFERQGEGGGGGKADREPTRTKGKGRRGVFGSQGGSQGRGKLTTADSNESGSRLPSACLRSRPPEGAIQMHFPPSCSWCSISCREGEGTDEGHQGAVGDG